MKKSFFTLTLSLLIGFAFAKQTASATPTVYQQLCGLNKYWVQHPITDPALQQTYEFSDHEALIRYHLMNVEYVLRHNPSANLSAEQKSNRTKALNILHDYWTAGVFPKNTHHNITIPYFIDDFNTACAVGHLIRETGYEAVACKIAAEMNYAYIEQMPYKELPQWATQMGFAVDELKWIQPAYSPPIRIESSIVDADCGVSNGAINSTVVDNFSGVPVNGYPQKWYSLKGNTVGFVGETASITNVPSGLYKADVIVGEGMFPLVYDLIGLSNEGNININANVQNETCFGSADGRIALNISGGVAPYSVRWYNQSGQVIGSNTVLDNLSSNAGGMIMYEVNVPQYTAEVTDAEGCKTFGQFNINYDHYSDFGYISATEAACGANNGTATINYPPEGSTFVWSHDATLTTNIATNLAAGTYTVTITNQYGCSNVQRVAVNNTGLSNFLWGNVSSTPDYCNQKVGSLTFNNLEGYTFDWSHDADYHLSSANNLEAGNYSITVTSASGCKAIYAAVISNYENIYTNGITLTNANSAAGTLGSAGVVLYDNPTINYSYAWSHNAALNSAVATDLNAGIYTLTITDVATNCTLVQSFEVYDEVYLSTFVTPNNFDVQPNLYLQNNTLVLAYNYTNSHNLQLSVLDVNGRTLVSKNLGAGNGYHQQSIAIDALPAGVYLLNLNNGKQQQTIKWVK